MGKSLFFQHMWGYLTLGTNYLWYGTLDGMGIFFHRVDYSKVPFSEF